MRAALSIIASNPEDPSHHEQFESSSSALRVIDSLVLHASEDLKVLLDPVTVAEMRDYGTANVDAYRDAREGNTFLASGTYESRRQAEALYRSATTKDPRFGYAYQMDAGMYASLAGSASSVQMTAADLHNAARLLSNPGSTTRYVRAGRNRPAVMFDLRRPTGAASARPRCSAWWLRREGLRFAIDEVVHHDDISGGFFQDAIPAGNPHEKDSFACIEPHTEER